MLAIIGGTSLSETGIAGELQAKTAENRYGKAYLLQGDGVLFLQRHGREKNIPAHMIDHRANLLALKESGAEWVIGVGSTGSLKKKITPGSIVIPDDYMNLMGDKSFFDSEIKHVTPTFDEDLRWRIIEAAGKAGIKAIPQGVYAQTPGVRLETRAEIRFLSGYADLVGMTVASEATLARELDMPYAAICTADNYANGITDEVLDFEEIKKHAEKNRERIEKILRKVLEGLR